MLPLYDPLRRIPRLVAGLILFGVGSGLMVRGDFGLSPWHVFHQGLAERTPLTIGTAVVLTGVVVLAADLLLREPIGIGTLLNVLLIGPSLDLTLAVVDRPGSAALRAALTIVGPLVVAVGSGLYLGVRLGPGPRDGLMTAMARRGVTIWKARSAIEATVLGVGVVLGGTIGWGTVWFLVSIGPAVQIALRLLSMRRHADEPAVDRYQPARRR